MRIITTREIHHAPGGTELFANFGGGRHGEPRRVVAAELIIEQVVGKIDERGGLRAVHLIGRGMRDGARVIATESRPRRKRGFHFRGVKKRRGLARQRIDFEGLCGMRLRINFRLQISASVRKPTKSIYTETRVCLKAAGERRGNPDGTSQLGSGVA